MGVTKKTGTEAKHIRPSDYRRAALNKQPMAVTLSWQHSYISKMIYELSKLARLIWELICDRSSLVLCTQVYGSLRVAVMIGDILVNRQTDIHVHTQTDSF